MMLGIDPKIDYAFKRLFGQPRNQALLVHFINAVLDPKLDRRVVSVEILNPFNEKETEGDKLSIVDIKAKGQLGRVFNVEMQMLPYRDLTKRLLYYWSRLHSQQLQEGEPYSDLNATILIAIVNGRIFPQDTEYHLCFELLDKKHSLLFTDDLELHILELPKFQKTADAIEGELEAWAYFLRHAERLDPQSLPATLDSAIVHQALKELSMLTQDQLERERYEARVKVHRDEISRMIAAREEGARDQLAAHIQQLEGQLQIPRTPLSELRSLSLNALRDRGSMLTQDQLERERYEARVELHRDEISRMIAATEHGARNELIENVQGLEQLLGLAKSPADLLEAKELPELRQYRDALQRKLRSQ